MFYVLYGNDGEARRAAREKLIGECKKNYGELALERFDGEALIRADRSNLLQGNDLFGRQRVVLLTHILEDAAAKDISIAHAKQFSASQNIFIWSEETIDVKTLTTLKNGGAHATEYTSRAEAKVKQGMRGSIFPLADAVGERNKKKAWVLFQRVLAEGARPEEIHGALFFGVKAMLLVQKSGREKTGLSPFPEQKARKFSKNYTERELEELSSKLFTIYHEAHFGRTELPVALEKFVLSI